MAELLYGSPGHRPLSSTELAEWQVWDIIVAEERKKAEAAASNGRR